MRKLLFLLVALFALTSGPGQADDARALQIMQRVDARDDGDNRIAKLSMTLIDRKGQERRRSLMTYMKDRGPDTLSLLFFEHPSSVRGTGFLTYDYRDPGKDDDQWLYLPELRKTKRIASTDKSQSFMGTDFSYADLTRLILEEWNYKLLGEREVRGKSTWLVEATPASNAIRQRYGYVKSVLFVRKDINMVVRAVHWLSGSELLKYLDVTSIKRVDNVWTAVELDMRTVRGKETLHRTVLHLGDVSYGNNIELNLFNRRTLETGV